MTEPFDLEKFNFQARAYVCGMRRAVVPPGHVLEGKIIVDTGAWHPRFREHPWVRAASRSVNVPLRLVRITGSGE